MFCSSSRRRHTRLQGDWSSDVCSSDLDIAQTHSALRALQSIDHISPAMLDAVDILVARDAHGNVAAAVDDERFGDVVLRKIGRASCGKECRSRWSPYH